MSGRWCFQLGGETRLHVGTPQTESEPPYKTPLLTGDTRQGSDCDRAVPKVVSTSTTTRSGLKGQRRQHGKEGGVPSTKPVLPRPAPAERRQPGRTRGTVCDTLLPSTALLGDTKPQVNSASDRDRQGCPTAWGQQDCASRLWGRVEGRSVHRVSGEK